ncbi:hypothetical protein [Streptomyces sp. NPDC006638]|uniref:hypothetical protein n=1 Tax=Streptomyces sp. NPDC006638 TaxID=3157183 RepID=UPI0033AE88CE
MTTGSYQTEPESAATGATDEIADKLGPPSGDPVLEIVQTTFDQNRRGVQS